MRREQIPDPRVIHGPVPETPWKEEASSEAFLVTDGGKTGIESHKGDEPRTQVLEGLAGP